MNHTRHGYWLEEAGVRPPSAPLSGAHSADVVVIGGGYTGMWAAWQLKRLEPEARVALLEAERCGHGPSGRNGGFVNMLWFSLPNMRERWGDGEALAVARASQEAVDGIEAFCREQEVECWFRRAGYLQVSTTPAHDPPWGKVLAACRALGAIDAIRALTPEQVEARCDSPAFRGAAFYPGAATVQPARLALGLRERLVAAGVEVFESSPVTSLRDGPGEVRAVTREGALRAGTAIVAIGGAAKAPHAPLRNSLTVTSSHIVLTEPVPDVLEETGWTGGECITDNRALVDYFRTTPDGRIAFGWGGGRIAMGARLSGRAEIDPEVVAVAARRLREYFPALEGRRLTHAWGGPIDVSPTHLPLVLPLPGGRAFAAAGYTGNGVGPSWMVGRALASLALDRRDDPSRLAFVDPSPRRVPPEPFHWLGGEVIRRALTAKEDAELAGERPDSVDALISRVPELVGFHIGR